jgi:hypothetical protein
LSLRPLAEGVAATLLVAFIIGSWIAIGTYFIRGFADDDEAVAPSALLIGSAITTFVLALCALAGWVEEGVTGAGIGCALALAFRRDRVYRILSSSLASLRRSGESAVMRITLLATVALMWISAGAPPRSADAMRYHLAHVRLLIEEGKWVKIPDFHFALPFGWTLSYLPFELLGIPQGAQLLGVALGVIMTASIVRLLVKEGAGRVGIGFALVMLLHPFVVRAFTEAGADPLAMFAVAATALLLLRGPDWTPSQAMLFGFVAWVALHSRYQAVAVGIAASVAFALAVRPHPGRRRLAWRAMTGAFAAGILASPFYLANLRWFGNPVWPLLIPRPDGDSAYSDVVAWHYGKSLTGKYDFGEVIGAAGNLLTWPRLFPLAIVIVGVLIAAKLSSQRELRIAGAFGVVFLALWVMMQPEVYPKFVLMMLPLAAITAGMWIGRGARGGANAWRMIQITAVAFLTVSVAVSLDPLRYFVSGDSRTFHRTTWFHPVFEWMNANTPEHSRDLVIVTSGMTYYLDRPYRRGDPWIGGEVDWLRTADGRALGAELRRRGYRYVVYEDRDWSKYEGGSEMQRTVADAVAAGVLIPVGSMEVPLFASRARGRYMTTRVRILEVRSGV